MAQTFVLGFATKFKYNFHNTPISKALVQICRDHSDVNLSFIYSELDDYHTSATIQTDDLYQAIRQITGLNPISVVRKNGNIFVEALQHGKYAYSGRLVSAKGEPIDAVTVMLLSPNDSTVITYGITDEAGRFHIPCDRQGVIGKMSCIGYRPKYQTFTQFIVGDITMQQLPIRLGTVTIEADNATLYSDKSIYRPSAKQKNASQTANDLLNRMAIPQLRIGEDITTNTGQTVSIYIDYVPATEKELSGMLISDVKSVEYYDYPKDPRFQGNAHVANFIMQKYEYGGYVKGVYYDNFTTSRQAQVFAKLQHKKVTLDWAGGIFYKNDKKTYKNMSETFRLPQDDGNIKIFRRNSVVDDSKNRQDSYWTSFKGLYRTDATTMSNMITLDFDRTPNRHTSGTVTYSPAEFQTTNYTSQNSNRINSVIYNGYWHFTLPHNNTITFNPSYAYTHTNQWSAYEEVGLSTINNGAIDDSHQANGDLAFVHSFGQYGTLKAMCQGKLLKNITHYSGSSSVSDNALTFRLGPGINYNYSNDKISVSTETGLHWDKSEYGDISTNSTAPWVNVAIQYAFTHKQSVSFSMQYRKSIPSSGYRSAAIIESYPLMSYTGNPNLVPYNSFLLDGNYILLPNKKFRISAYGWAWIVGNRYAFDYEATPTGILRTIKQPLGSYAQWQYGLQSSLHLFDDNLQLGINCFIVQAHNGTPYNWHKTKFATDISAYYYLGKLYLGSTYNSPQGYPDGCMDGEWTGIRSSYTFQVGWSDKHWNLRFFTRNFLRHNTYHYHNVMKSKYYDTNSHVYSSSNTGFFQISATYTFGFGKKVKVGNEAYQASGASSGILSK